MTKKYILILLGTFCFLTACVEAENQSAQTTQPAPENNNNNSNDNNSGSVTPDPVVDEPQLQGPKVCYLKDKNCMQVFSSENIFSKSDYNYRNPSGSFSASLAKQYQMPKYFIDLENSSNSLNVTQNFKTSEYMQSFKGRYGLYSPLVAKNVQAMRELIGKSVRVTSGYRGPAYNAKIGGATWSRHMYGDALDFQVSGKSPASLKKYCEQLGASFIQVYVAHVHCDWRLAPLPKEFYSSDAGQDLVLSKAAVSLKAELHKHYDQDTQIYIEGRPVIGGSLTVGIESYESEEGSSLYTEWSVYKNNQLIFESKKPAFKINNLKAGEYEIRANVGGYWKKSSYFVVK